MLVVAGCSSSISPCRPAGEAECARRPEHAVASITVLAFGAIEDPLPLRAVWPRLFGPLITRFMILIALIRGPVRRRNPGRQGGRR